MLGIYTLKSMQMLLCYQFCDDESLFRIFFGMGGGVKYLLFHAAPPTTKHRFKICFSPFHEAFDSFSYFKNRAPRNNPGMHSWMTSRNALLGDLQEHAPGQVLGTYSGTLLEC